MPRPASVEFLSQDQLTFLFPQEIISRLDGLVADIPVDLSRKAADLEPVERQLELLDEVLDHIESRLNKEPDHRIRALTENHQKHLASWILRSRRQAYALLETQPDTPLGFQKGVRGVISNLLFASWFDLTEGGNVDIQWKKLD